MIEDAAALAKSFGYLTEREVDAIHRMMQLLPPVAVALNVGAGSGTSALAMAEGHPRLTIWTIDSSPGGPYGGIENEIQAFEKSGLRDMPWRWSRRVLGDSRVVARWWKERDGPYFDFAFIDDGHLAAEIKGDIEGWLPLVKPGGIIAFHDYGRKAWPDVRFMVDQLMAGYRQTLHVDTLIAFYNEVDNG